MLACLIYGQVDNLFLCVCGWHADSAVHCKILSFLPESISLIYRLTTPQLSGGKNMLFLMFFAALIHGQVADQYKLHPGIHSHVCSMCTVVFNNVANYIQAYQYVLYCMRDFDWGSHYLCPNIFMSNLVDSNKYCNSVLFPSFSQVAQVETIWLFCLYYSLFI